ncbi:unnamed protein product [Rotaria sp. Silwood2]|nr:unnamed protein product [Rotaria sp. Silwood2]
MQMRVAYHGLIYRKILRLSSRSLTTISSGEIVNIFSNDASQIEMTVHSINYLWLTLVDIIAMIAFFWYFVNYVSFIAIGYTLMLVLLVSLMSRLLVHFRRKILKVTDQRIKTMSEIIKSMRIVKMYCWESAFVKKVLDIRKREIIRCALRLIPETMELFFSQTYACITFFIVYGAMWSFHIPFDTRFFVVASCILNYLGLSVLSFGSGIRNFVNYLTAAKRLQTFLLLDESERDRRLLSISDKLETDEHLLTNKMAIEKKNIVQTSLKKFTKVECNLKLAGWEQNGLFLLKNIVFTVYPGDLICIIGPIGSGKSSLLQTLTGEIPFFDGQVRLHGSFCYVPQEPWIFSSTVKKNILFGKDYDPQLFRRVVDATALEAGEMIQTGTYDELLARSSSFSRLLEDIHQQEKEQIERPMNIPQRQSSRHLTLIENEHEDDLLIDSENFETTEKGSVKWDVYITYLQEGVGVLFGIFIIIFIFGFHQATSIVYSWWLAKWSDDESQRHGHQSNCTKIINQKINMIRSMNDTEWNEYRNGRFYFYCG